MHPSPRPSVPLRTLLVSTVALEVPVLAQALAPARAVEYELLLWLVALVPGFLLAYHRGWRGAATALALGMAVLSITQAALLYTGRGVRDWTLMLAVVAIYLAVSIGVGWVTELLHRAREQALRMAELAHASEQRAQDMAVRLRAVAEVATAVLSAPDPPALAEIVRQACARAVDFDQYDFLLRDEDGQALLPVWAGDPGELPGDPDAAISGRASLRVAVAEPGCAVRSLLHVPLLAEERELGVIVLAATRADAFSDEDVQVIEALAASAAGSLLNLEMLLARDAAGEALAANEARFRALVEDASELTLVLDSAGRVRYESPAVWRLVGHRRRSERDPFGCVHPDQRATVRARFASLTAGRSGTAVAEVRVRHRNGSWRTLEVLATNLLHDPSVGGVVVNARDITAQKEAVERLRESEHRYRRFFENDLTGDYLADADGTLVECNPRFAEIFGFPSAAAARGTALAWLHPDGAAAVDALREQLRRDGRVEGQATRMRRVEGQEVHTVQNAVGIFDEHGELVQLLGYVYDVTEHRQTEDQLRHAQKLDAVGQLAGGVAHDFNNMLMAILGFASLVENEVEPESAAAGYAAQVQDAALRAADLTHQLLAFSRRQVLQPRYVEPNLAVASAQQMLRRLLPESIAVETVLDPLPGTVRVDPTQFQQVLLNLAVNARDAMPGGGRLTISTRSLVLSSSEALQRGLPEGPYLQLSLQDTGCGMDRATLERVYEPFFTTKEAGQGTGLGLSTVHGIVHQSGGHIHAESEPGVGTTFSVLLPRHSVAEDETVPAVELPAARSAGTVLLAEDEESVRLPMRHVMEKAGFQVIAAADGEEALRLAEAYGEELDLLVTDAVMPRMGGARLAAELRKRQPRLRVLVVSGYPDRVVATQEGGLPERAVFLQKPVMPGQLVTAMREALAATA